MRSSCRFRPWRPQSPAWIATQAPGEGASKCEQEQTRSIMSLGEMSLNDGVTTPPALQQRESFPSLITISRFRIPNERLYTLWLCFAKCHGYISDIKGRQCNHTSISRPYNKLRWDAQLLSRGRERWINEQVKNIADHRPRWATKGKEITKLPVYHGQTEPVLAPWIGIGILVLSWELWRSFI